MRLRRKAKHGDAEDNYWNFYAIWFILLRSLPWWRHQMETFSALLAICAGNSPVTGKFPAQRPVTRSFNVFFDPCLYKRLSKQSRGWWFETPSRPLWRHCDDSVCALCFRWIAYSFVNTCLTVFQPWNLNHFNTSFLRNTCLHRNGFLGVFVLCWIWFIRCMLVFMAAKFNHYIVFTYIASRKNLDTCFCLLYKNKSMIIPHWTYVQDRCRVVHISISVIVIFLYMENGEVNLHMYRLHVSFITVTEWWARVRLKSPVSRLFTPLFIQVQINESIKAPRHWPLCGHRSPVNSPHKGPVTRKMFPFHDVFMIKILFWCWTRQSWYPWSGLRSVKIYTKTKITIINTLTFLL